MKKLIILCVLCLPALTGCASWEVDGEGYSNYTPYRDSFYQTPAPTPTSVADKTRDEDLFYRPYKKDREEPVNMQCSISNGRTTCSNGQNYNHVGNKIYTSSGTVYHTDGNEVYSANGRTYHQSGNAIYASDGTIYRTDGDVTYGSDGSIYRRWGNRITVTNAPAGKEFIPAFIDTADHPEY